ncbi:MAG: acyltransferase [Candidatus Aenigmarchaeota archaeon]|nr:acyltransferase [Candidatus Aenigmarchaeota archaeon]
MRRLERHAVREHNSLWYWKQAKNPLVVTKNVVLMKLAKIIPPGIRNPCYRLMGIKIGKYARVGMDATMDIFFPELIEIGDETIIGANAMILTHEFLQKEWRRGRVRIGRRCMIGANSTILAGVTIGDGASVSAATLVDRDVPAHARAYGNPMVVERIKK